MNVFHCCRAPAFRCISDLHDQASAFRVIPTNLATVADFAFSSADTKLSRFNGRFFSGAPLPDGLYFAFRPLCETRYTSEQHGGGNRGRARSSRALSLRRWSSRFRLLYHLAEPGAQLPSRIRRARPADRNLSACRAAPIAAPLACPATRTEPTFRTALTPFDAAPAACQQNSPTSHV